MANLQHHAQPEHTDLDHKASGQSRVGGRGHQGVVSAIGAASNLFGGDTLHTGTNSEFLHGRKGLIYTSTMLRISQ